MSLLEIFDISIRFSTLNIALTITIIAGGFGLASEYKVLMHPRYRLRFFVFLILTILIANGCVLKIINIFAVTIFLILLSVYAVLSYKASLGVILYSKKKIEELGQRLRDGYAFELKGLFEKKPIYMIDDLEKFEFLMLKVECYVLLGKYKEAYKVCETINEDRFFDKEKNQLYIKKAYIMWHLGDIRKAKHLLGLVGDKPRADMLVLKSLIAEREGDLKTLSECLEEALNLTVQDKNPRIKAMIFHNYGRLRYLEENYMDAIDFYEQAIKVLEGIKNDGQVHVTYSNLIHTYGMNGDLMKARKTFERHMDFVESKEEKNLNDIIESFNAAIILERQTHSAQDLSKIILDGYERLSSMLTEEQRHELDINVLGMLVENGMSVGIVMDRIENNLDYYFSLQMPEKYFVLAKIRKNLARIYHYKYQETWNRIGKYMQESALKELEEYRLTLEDYEVAERLSIQLEECKFKTEWIKDIKIDSLYRSLLDIKDTYEKNGLLLDTIKIDLEIMEFFYMKNLGKGRKVIEQHMNLALEEVKRLRNHPFVAEINLRVAVCYRDLGDYEKMWRHLRAFDESNTSINNFAPYFKEFYIMQKRLLSLEVLNSNERRIAHIYSLPVYILLRFSIQRRTFALI